MRRKPRPGRWLCPLPARDEPGRQPCLFTEHGGPDSRQSQEINPDFLEFLSREDIDEPEPAWEP